MSIFTENQIYNLERLVEKLSCKISEIQDDQNFLLDKIVELELKLNQSLPKKNIVCKSCNDTHSMNLGEDREVPCTFCPVPCEKCRQNLGAYCKTTPCVCECHKKSQKKKKTNDKLYWFRYRVVNVDAGITDQPYLTGWSKKKVAANSEKEAKILFGLTDADYVYRWQKTKIKKIINFKKEFKK